MMTNGLPINNPVVMVKPRKRLLKNAIQIIRLGKAEVGLGITMTLLGLLSFIGDEFCFDFATTRLLAGIVIIASGSVGVSIKHKYAGPHFYRSNLGLSVVGAILASISVAVSLTQVILLSSRSLRPYIIPFCVQVLLSVVSLAAGITCILHATFCCSECCCCGVEENMDIITLDLNHNGQQIVPTRHGRLVAYMSPPPPSYHQANQGNMSMDVQTSPAHSQTMNPEMSLPVSMETQSTSCIAYQNNYGDTAPILDA